VHNLLKIQSSALYSSAPMTNTMAVWPHGWCV